MKRLSIILFSLVLLSACFKEEDKREAFGTYKTLALGNDYLNQFFISLSDTGIVSSNDYRIWNIGFYCGNDASYIRLNAAANMWVYKTNRTDFGTSFDLNYPEEDKRFDGTHHLTDYLAIDQILPANSSSDTLFTDGSVYLIHPGIDANGLELGTVKQFVFVGSFEDTYLIKYAELDGSNVVNASIPKNESLNFLSYSFENQTLVQHEPDKATWDLIFTRYSDTVYTTDGSDFYLTGYAVTGAYLNITGVSAYLTETKPYTDFSSNDVDESLFTTNLNAIGHEWKQFSDQYNIYKNKVYIIKDRNGFIYKLRFLDFYDSASGNKGYPSFEYALL